MTKNKKHIQKLEDESFSVLGEELEKAISVAKTRDALFQRLKMGWFFIALALPICLLLIILFSIIQPLKKMESVPPKSTVISASSTRAGDKGKAAAQSFVDRVLSEAETKDTFNWTLDKYRTLTADWDNKNSDTFEKVVKKYGKPSQVDVQYNNVEHTVPVVVTYEEDSDDQKMVTLYFLKKDGDYRLYSKSFYNLQDLEFQEASGQDFTFRWTKTESDMLSDEIASDSKKIIEPKDIIDKYGLPTSVFSAGRDDWEQLTLTYQKDNDPTATINSVTLYFEKETTGYKLINVKRIFKE